MSEICGVKIKGLLSLLLSITVCSLLFQNVGVGLFVGYMVVLVWWLVKGGT